ncbi:MAG: hypothetical protein COB37_11320 [Kordiimonadales bacterium]|nr:MAG: hypothetical protein COB37_11320 [Kordiimonadales bacterium]
MVMNKIILPSDANAAKRKVGISVRITLGVATLVVLVIALATLSFFALKRFQDDIVQLSTSALPALADAASLSTELEGVLLGAVQLTRVRSHAERRIALQDTRAGLETATAIAAKLQPTNPGQLLEATLNVLATTIEDLNQIKSSQLDAAATIKLAENELNNFTFRISNELQTISTRGLTDGERRALAGWQSDLTATTLKGLQVIQLDSLRQVRRLQASLTTFTRALRQSHITSRPFFEAFQLEAEKGLIGLLFDGDGLFPAARATLRKRQQAQGLEQQTRVLVNEIVNSMASLTDTINRNAKTNADELINFADEQILYIKLAGAMAFLIAIFVFFYFDRWISSRLRALNEAVISQTEGDTAIIPIQGRDEIGEIGRSVSFFIGEIDRRQKQIRTSERQFRDIVEGSVQAILIIADDAPLFWNQALVQMFGFSSSSEHTDFAAVVERLPHSALTAPEAGKIKTFNRVRINTLATEEKWVDLATTAIVWNGIPATQIIIADVTHSVEVEKTLQSAKEKAEEAAQAKTQFLATMSHEIRSPMNGIIAMSTLLQESNLKAEYHDMSSVINQSANALLSIIDDILDFSKIESGKLDIEVTEFEIIPLLKSIGELMAPKFQQRGIEFVLDVSQSLPQTLHGDANRLRQIMINLVGNAEKFTSKGHVRLKVQAIEEENEQEVSVSFAVEDTGIGINAETLPQLFTPFKQAEASTARQYGGSGLGLSICKHLAGLMGGTITAISEPGTGSTFTCTLPFQPGKPAQKTNRKKLLGTTVVVWVHKAAREMATRVISHEGGTPVMASRTDDLSKVIPKKALVVVDASLVSGDEIAQKKLARALAGKDARVVLISPHGSQFRPDLFKFPVAASLNKPITGNDLIGRLIAAKDGETAEPATEEFRQRNYIVPKREVAEAGHALILVAEDNPINQVVIRKSLDHLGFAIDLAENGQEALDLYKSNHYGLILTDLHMPLMDGFDFVSAVRRLANDHARTVPIIALSADVLLETKEKGRAVGINAFLPKPVNLDDLNEAICHWLPAAASCFSRASNCARTPERTLCTQLLLPLLSTPASRYQGVW